VRKLRNAVMNNNIASEQVLNRACDACRFHKIRCIPKNSASSKSCQRCSKIDRQCVFTVTQRRKQRKRTDTRVAELEREVQAMRSLFELRRSSIGEETPGSEQSPKESSSKVSRDASTVNSALSKSLTTVSDDTPHPEPFPDTSQPKGSSPTSYCPDQDVVDRGLISSEQADQLFQAYNKHLVLHNPAVLFPLALTAQELRQTKPILFLSVIAAASAMTDPHLFSVLNSEVLSAYAYRTTVLGEKSLELVQAMLVNSIWYYPPGKFAKLKFYEFIHMATVMALDIGLGNNLNASRSRRRGLGISEHKKSKALEEEELENRRTFLACYMITTG
jgi:hypothetical protein